MMSFKQPETVATYTFSLVNETFQNVYVEKLPCDNIAVVKYPGSFTFSIQFLFFSSNISRKLKKNYISHAIALLHKTSNSNK